MTTKAMTNPKKIIGDVEKTVQKYVGEGSLVLPDNYIAGNALRAANLILSETKDKNKNLALDVCTFQSVSRALLRMIVLGLNPLKEQCYFIVYGNQLTCMESYHGKRNIVRRLTGYKMIAQIVYDGDEFEFEYNDTGDKRIIQHKSALKNINNKNIIGAYVVASKIDINGVKQTETEIMTIEEIKAAWKKSKINPEKDGSTHKEFTQQMCKRTVTNRLATKLISETDDTSNPVMQKFAMEEEIVPDADIINEEQIDEEIEENANKEKVIFDEEQQESQKESEPPKRGRPKNEDKTPSKEKPVSKEGEDQDNDDPF